MGLSPKQMGKVFAQYPGALVVVPLSDLQLTISAVRNCGVNKPSLPELLLKAPALLGRPHQAIYDTRKCAFVAGPWAQCAVIGSQRVPAIDGALPEVPVELKRKRGIGCWSAHTSPFLEWLGRGW